MTGDRDQPGESAPREAPRETVSGDRLCMRCLHPLAGSAILREPTTGLLYCRCVECGTAAALLEYPTVTPWVRRMKSVAAAFLVTVALLATLVGVGVGGFFPSLARGQVAVDSSEALVAAYRETGGSTRDPAQQYDSGQFGVADLEWLESDAGRAALVASRTSREALLPLVGFALLATTLLVPAMLLLGLVCMRRSPLVRALVGLLVPSIGAALSVVATLGLLPVRAGWQPGMSWTSYCIEENGPIFSMVTIAWLAIVGAVTALAAPPLAAALFRFILPPADRRLVAWIWEWRGKPIPKD